MDPATNFILTALAAAGNHLFQNGFHGLNDELTERAQLKRISSCFSTNRTIYDYMVENLNTSFTDLTAYQGRVLLIVNTATYCGFCSDQFPELNKLIGHYGPAKFNVLAFPCNQFGGNEPGKNSEILNGLKFVRPGKNFQPHAKGLKIFGKIDVNGKNQHNLYKFLTKQCPPTTANLGNKENLHYDPIKVNDINGNFEKILVDKNGIPRYRFHATAWKGGAVPAKYIEKLLKEK